MAVPLTCSIRTTLKRLRASDIAGTGLCFAMWERIVERYNGKTWVESVYGQGPTFWFSLSGTDVGGQQ